MGNACCGNESGAQVQNNMQKKDNNAAAPAPAQTTPASPKAEEKAQASSSNALDLPVMNINLEANVEKKEEPGSDVDAHVVRGAGLAKKANVLENKDDGADLFGTAKVEKVEFGAVRPWKGQVFPPTQYKGQSVSSSAPSVRLDLEWAYGYRGYDAHDNIAVDRQGRIVYPVAAVVVAYDPQTHTQSHFLGHNDDVTSLCQSRSDANLFASGQVATIEDLRGTKPRICIWDSSAMKSLATLKDVFKRSVVAMAFSQSGKYLAALGDDVGDGFTCKVWDWQAGKLMAVADADKDPNTLFGITWKNDEEFVTVGTKHIFFWEFTGASLKKNRGLVGSAGLQTFLCAEYFGAEHCLVGARDGSIYFFKGRQVVSTMTATQTGPVYSIVATSNGFVTGARDGTLRVWDRKLKQVNAVEIDSSAGIRSIYLKGDRAVVGTDRCQIFDVAGFSSSGARASMLVTGHFDGELWGLDVNPRDTNQAVTVGEDNQIYVYDLAKHNVISRGFINTKPNRTEKRKHEKASTMSAFPTEQCARSVCYSPDASVIAVGTNEGEVAIYTTSNLSRTKLLDLNTYGKQQVADSKKWGNWIQNLRFNPAGTVLAAATRGIVTVLIDVTKDYTPVTALNKSNATVTHCDWSADGKHLRTNDRAYEVLYYDVPQNIKESAQNTASASLADVQWASDSCPMTWASEMMFDPNMDGTDVNITDRSPDGKLIANGDDFGYVNVYSFPVRNTKQGRVSKTGHSSHVMNVKFTKDGKYLISAGGNDKSVMQWKITSA